VEMGPLTGSLGLQGAWGCRLATCRVKNWLQWAWDCRLATYRAKELASRGLGL